MAAAGALPHGAVGPGVGGGRGGVMGRLCAASFGDSAELSLGPFPVGQWVRVPRKGVEGVMGLLAQLRSTVVQGYRWCPSPWSSGSGGWGWSRGTGTDAGGGEADGGLLVPFPVGYVCHTGTLPPTPFPSLPFPPHPGGSPPRRGCWPPTSAASPSPSTAPWPHSYSG